MIDRKYLKRSAGMVSALSLAPDMLMMGIQQLDKGGRIPVPARKFINIAGVAGVNAAWLLTPLARQPRLRNPWKTAARALGVTFMAAGAYLGWSSTRDRGIIGVETPDSLVVKGLYGRMRHPTYAAIMAGSLGWSLFRGSPFSAAVMPVLFAQLLIGGLYEESVQLKPLFGQEYEAYRKSTPFLPACLILPIAGSYLLMLCGMSKAFLEEPVAEGES